MRRTKYAALLILSLAILLSGCGGSALQEPPNSQDMDIPPFNPPVSTADSDKLMTPRPLKVFILSVGQADSIYIQMPDGRNVLIDGGQGDDVVKRMREIGVWGKRIHLLVLTHPHIDHVRGLLYILNGCPVSKVWETGVIDNDFNPWYAEWRRRVSLLGIADQKVKRGNGAIFGSAKLAILAPFLLLDGKQVPIVNNSSIVMRLSYGSFSALLMADAEKEEQAELLPTLSHTQLFKVPHHGAANAALEATYVRTKPDVAVATASWASSLVGIPSSEALSLINRYCGRYFVTWRSGTVCVSTEGNGYQVTTAR